MLPYMEQKPLYDSINFYFLGGYDYGNTVNGTAWNTVVNVFLCPSDGNAGKANTNSYYASFGTTTVQYGPNGSTGLFGKYETYGLRDVTDGTSQTIAFSEGLVGAPTTSPTKRGTSVTGVSGAGAGQYFDASDTSPPNQASTTNVLADMQACTTAYLAGSNLSGSHGQRWGWGAVGMTEFNTIVPPNSKQYPWTACRNDCGGCSPDQAEFSNATSNHPGGVNVLMGDGSVKFIKDSVAMPVWWRLGTRAGNEPVSADQF